MSAPYINRRVKVTGTSKPELNDQEGRATGYNRETNRYTVLLDNGRSVSLKVANLIPGPVEDDSPSSGIPGMSGMPGMPDMSKLFAMMPPWLSSKLMRGEMPNMNDLIRLLPPGVTLTHIGIVSVLFFVMVFRYGFMKSLIFFSFVVGSLYFGYTPYVEAGGGVSGLKAASNSLGRKFSYFIYSLTQQNIPEHLSIIALGAVSVAMLYYVFIQGGLAPIDSQSQYSGPTFTAEDAYDEGYADAKANRPHDWIGSDSYRYASSRDRSASGVRSGSGFGAFSMPSLGIGNIFTIAMLGRQVYSLGSIPGGGWDMGLAYSNFMHMATMQKVFMGMMLLRLFGLSPI